MRALVLTLLAALAVMLMGGEGRWFYATPDWQVRYAVLRDLTLQPWPFAYTMPEGPLMLRLPVGMVLALALFWAFSGMDVIGQALQRSPLSLHLETWAGLQFSSHVTQAL